MFTGIVTDVGRVRAVRDTNRDRRFEIETGFDTATIDIGASISHAGCCLTVVERGDGWFAVEVSKESLGLTTLGDWRPGGGMLTVDGAVAIAGQALDIGPAQLHYRAEILDTLHRRGRYSAVPGSWADF